MIKYQESEEMYLETLLLLKNELNEVRAIDIARRLNYSRASVSRGLKLLQNKNLVLVSSNGDIEFTKLGKIKAEEIYDRHCVITKLLIGIGASKELAEENACRIEHVISQELFEKIKKYVNNK